MVKIKFSCVKVFFLKIIFKWAYIMLTKAFLNIKKAHFHFLGELSL